jgi:hypothetical protein
LEEEEVRLEEEEVGDDGEEEVVLDCPHSQAPDFQPQGLERVQVG